MCFSVFHSLQISNFNSKNNGEKKRENVEEKIMTFVLDVFFIAQSLRLHRLGDVLSSVSVFVGSDAYALRKILRRMVASLNVLGLSEDVLLDNTAEVGFSSLFSSLP